MSFVKTLSTLLLGATLYAGCGPTIACKSDEDCKPGSTCSFNEEDGAVCRDAQGNITEPVAASEGNACGDSLLTGNYLSEMECHYGTPVPFSEDPCEGTLSNKHGNYPVTYQGMTIFNFTIDYDDTAHDYELSTVHLRRDLTREDFKDYPSFLDYYDPGRCGCFDTGPASFDNFKYRRWLMRRDYHEIEIAKTLCRLMKAQNFYLVAVEGKDITQHLHEVFLVDQPWYDKESCKERTDLSFDAECSAEHPFPDIDTYYCPDDGEVPWEECIARLEASHPSL